MKQSEINEHVARLLQGPMTEGEQQGAMKGAARTSPAHTDRCRCGEEWQCSNQHITKMDPRTSLPVWTDIPEGGAFGQLECLSCADPFRDMSSLLA